MRGETAFARQNREDWLEAAIEELQPTFATAGHGIPRVHVSVGLPNSTKKRGQCHARGQSADGLNHIFLAAALADAADVLEVLVHELVHACLDCKGGHRGKFQVLAAALGLAGPPWTSTKWTEEGLACARRIIEAIGPYPHGRLAPQGKHQTNRTFKCLCMCGYAVRMTRVWLASHGAPLCPACARSLAVPPEIETKPLDTQAFAFALMTSLDRGDLLTLLEQLDRGKPEFPRQLAPGITMEEPVREIA